MKTLSKFFVSVLVTLSITAFLSCASVHSTENVITFLTENGQTNYLNQTVISIKSPEVETLTVDLTYITQNKTVVADGVFNYTLLLTPAAYNMADNTELVLLFNGKEINLSNKEILFKNLDKNKNLSVRFTSKLPKESLEEILKQYEPVMFNLKLSDQTVYNLDSKIFNQKINDARVIF